MLFLRKELGLCSLFLTTDIINLQKLWSAFSLENTVIMPGDECESPLVSGKAHVSFLILFALFLRKTKFLRHQVLNGSGFPLTFTKLQIPRFSVLFSKAELRLYCAETSGVSGNVKVSVDQITV